jgi:hypothetical protein
MKENLGKAAQDFDVKNHLHRSLVSEKDKAIKISKQLGSSADPAPK